jgi:hypothetical protein
VQCEHTTHDAFIILLLLLLLLLLCSYRFRAVHEEVVKLDQDFGATFSGVLTDDEGRIRALWGSYAEQV